MSALVPAKITAQHLERTAYVYVRQSTMTQVHEHLESQRRQYPLAEHARTWGWQQVEVVDDDLGRSGSGRTAELSEHLSALRRRAADPSQARSPSCCPPR